MKPKCKLIGEDGNVFNIIGRVCRALKQNGMAQEAEQFQSAAFNSQSYDDVLSLAMDYADVI